LSEKNKKMILVPKGCANGIQTLIDNCQIEYFMSKCYSSKYGAGIRWDDPFFKIKWPIKKIFLSEKDKSWKYYKYNLTPQI
jgi:dTDP-4-dehydrorhamnose 3,5-epimerase